MSESSETIADIIAEMRHKDTARRRFTLTDAFGGYETITIDRANTMLSLAARIEVALRRERGDCAKLREALEALMIDFDSNYAGDDDIASWCDVNVETVRKARAALSAPPRNCDVGTAQEQDERFHRFCVKHHTGSCAGCHNPVGDYTVANGVRECALVWAQMPYEEGGAR